MSLSKLIAWAAGLAIVCAAANPVLAASFNPGFLQGTERCSGPAMGGGNCISPPHLPPSDTAPPKLRPPKSDIVIIQKCAPPLVGTKPNCHCPEGGDGIAGGKCVSPPQKCEPPLIGTKPNCHCPERGDAIADGKCVSPPQKCEPPLIGTKPNCRCPERGDAIADGKCVSPPQKCDPPLIGMKPNCYCPERGGLNVEGKCMPPPQKCEPPLIGMKPNCYCPNRTDVFFNGQCEKPGRGTGTDSGQTGQGTPETRGPHPIVTIAPVVGTLPGRPPVFAIATPLLPGKYRPNEVLVVLQPGETAEIAQLLARDFTLQLGLFAPSRSLRTAIVRYHIPDARSVETVLAALTRDPRVLAAQANYLYHPAAGASVPASALPQYGLDIIHAREALANVKAGHTPLVAVIDTGIDESHPDLAGAVRDRFDAVGDGLWDVSAHGTGIAGIIAARGQLQGVDPSAALLSVRAFPAALSDGVAEATSLSLVRGIDWSLEAHADVINMSLAGPPDPIVDAAVEEAMKAGVIVVAAAGNDGPDAPPAYPAAVKGVVAVTATDEHDGVFQGANRGAYISIAAPGVDVLSDAPGGGVALATGTSQAAAEVSGVLAMLRALQPGLTPAQALELLGKTAKSLGSGAGRVDAAAAVEGLGK